MSDGRLWFNTKIDNSQVEKDLKELERKIRKSEESISKNENAKLPLVKQLDEAKKKLEKARTALAGYKADLVDAATKSTDPAEAIEATAALPEARALVATQEREVEKLQKNWESINNKVEGYDRKILQANTDIERNKAKAAELTAQLNSSGAKMAEAFDKAHVSADKFAKKIAALAKRALVFSVITAGLNKIKEYMNKALKTNEEYTAQLAKLKGALLTAFQPIYEFVLPGVLAVLKVLTSIVQVVANVLSVLTGKTAAQSAQDAKALNEEADAIEAVGGAAQNAKKHLADFDEINTLGANTSDGGSSSGTIDPDFSEFDTAQYKAKIAELTVYLSGALLAIGAILAFSGANIPLGIALMAAGALGLVAIAKENWNSMETSLEGPIARAFAVVSVALLVIGAIFTFSGINIPLGIALMVAGAAVLGTGAALDWDSIKTALQDVFDRVVSIIKGVALMVVGLLLACTGIGSELGIALIKEGAAEIATAVGLDWGTIEKKVGGAIDKVGGIIKGVALIVVGLLLACTGVGLELGIALIKEGAGEITTATGLNWDAVLEKLKGAWENIKLWFETNVAPKLTLAYWKEKFSGITDGLSQNIKDGVNGSIANLNWLISWINSYFHIKWDELKIGNKTIIPAVDYQLITIPSIPYLAQGAVLPANKPFLAMVGDQKNGTNVEAPLETIKQAVAEVMAVQGTGDITITFTGDLAQLGRVLKPVIDKENRRVGGSLAKGVT